MAVDRRAREHLRQTAGPARHPLDPLAAEEIALAVRIVKAEKRLAASIRFENVEL